MCVTVCSCEKVVAIVFEDLNPLLDGLMTRERWLVGVAIVGVVWLLSVIKGYRSHWS